MKILFLAAGNRVSLLEQFLRAGFDLGLKMDKLELHSIERDESVPIAKYATIHVGHDFGHSECLDDLISKVLDIRPDIIIPNHDAVLLHLALLPGGLPGHRVISQRWLVEACFNKYKTRQLTERAGVKMPFIYPSTQLPSLIKDGVEFIVKPASGWGSVGFRRGGDIRPEQIESLQALVRDGEYIAEEYIAGTEYTVDAYVGTHGHILGCFSRIRVQVIDGEVNRSVAFRNDEVLEAAKSILCGGFGSWAERYFYGPITLQFIHGPEGVRLIEINPRFGGGVTHAIHCGLDMPRWIMEESWGYMPDPFDDWKNGSLMVRARQDVFFDKDDIR